MDESLADIYRRAGYLVWTEPAAWVRLVPDQPLPGSLHAIVGAAPWALVTACNPQARPHQDADNLRGQAALFDALRRLSATARILTAIGIGAEGWHEPSLFVIGLDSATLDPLMRRFGQIAYLHGTGAGPVQLRWTSS
jgi:hypothetical protein